MTRNELIQLHIDRLIHYSEEYESAFLEFIKQFPLIETHEGIYTQLKKPIQNDRPNEREPCHRNDSKQGKRIRSL